MSADNTPVGLRTPWVWVQPSNHADLVKRLEEARDYDVPRREYENLCGCAALAIRNLRDEAIASDDSDQGPTSANVFD